MGKIVVNVNLLSYLQLNDSLSKTYKTLSFKYILEINQTGLKVSEKIGNKHKLYMNRIDKIYNNKKTKLVVDKYFLDRQVNCKVSALLTTFINPTFKCLCIFVCVCVCGICVCVKNFSDMTSF